MKTTTIYLESVAYDGLFPTPRDITIALVKQKLLQKYTIKQTATMLGIGRATLYRYLDYDRKRTAL